MRSPTHSLNYDGEVEVFSEGDCQPVTGHRGYRMIQQIDGVGPTFAAIFIAEIGNVHRFARPEKLSCWLGLTAWHRESDTTMRCGSIISQGFTLLRWAAIEACQRTRLGAELAAHSS